MSDLPDRFKIIRYPSGMELVNAHTEEDRDLLYEHGFTAITPYMPEKFSNPERTSWECRRLPVK